MDKVLARLIKVKREKIQINKKKWRFTTDMAEIQRIMRQCYGHLNTNKLENLKEIDNFLQTYNLPRLNHEQIENVSKQITNKEFELVIKQTIVQEQMASLMNSTEYLRIVNI